MHGVYGVAPLPPLPPLPLPPPSPPPLRLAGEATATEAKNDTMMVENCILKAGRRFSKCVTGGFLRVVWSRSLVLLLGLAQMLMVTMREERREY